MPRWWLVGALLLLLGAGVTLAVQWPRGAGPTGRSAGGIVEADLIRPKRRRLSHHYGPLLPGPGAIFSNQEEA